LSMPVVLTVASHHRSKKGSFFNLIFFLYFYKNFLLNIF
jgi:hypothetical protein